MLLSGLGVSLANKLSAHHKLLQLGVMSVAVDVANLWVSVMLLKGEGPGMRPVCTSLRHYLT